MISNFEKNIFVHQKCKMFDLYLEAGEYHKVWGNIIRETTMLPICKYVPKQFHNLILHYKLSKIYVKSSIY